MARRIKERLRSQEVKTFVGRREEMATLLAALADDGPLVTFVYGLGGIGKSSLLKALLAVASSRGATVITLDCRTVQPSAAGFLAALSEQIGQPLASAEAAADCLAHLDGMVALALDTYELFRLLDTWLRQVFVPNLPDNVRLFCFGREAPVAAWVAAPGWQGLLQSLRLGPLDRQDAAELLQQAGLAEAEANRINYLANGHPLALKLAAAAASERPDLRLENIEAQQVVETLARLYLDDIREPLTRRVLEAASVIRRTTRPLLGAMLPELNPVETYDRLAGLPFVEITPEGLLVHDTVRQAVETLLRAADPGQYRAYRRAAWQQLRAEWATMSKPHLWRYTADTIYLIEHPVIRDAFFPPGGHQYALEPARPEDGPAILAITARHDGPESTAALAYWWQKLPGAFFVARDAADQVAGYYTLFDPAKIDPDLLRPDALLWRWWQHVQADPAPRGQNVVFCRRMLAADTGENLSNVQAACWLDVKRTYLANPLLRRIYTTVRNVKLHQPIVAQLGFKLFPDLATPVDGQTFGTLMNDFGPDLVPGWLAGLVEAQYGPEPVRNRLDAEARELILDGQAISLTPLEFGVIHCLYLREGKAVSRADLLEEVWGYDYDGGGSNVVDSIIRSLRKKMGDHAAAIETVTGVGYRFRGF